MIMHEGGGGRAGKEVINADDDGDDDGTGDDWLKD